VRVALLLLVLSLAACSPREGDGARRYQLTGTVTAFDTSSTRVVVAHDEVKGLMPAMSMPFEIRGGAPAMHDGDRIMATLVVTDSRSWLEDVRVGGAGGIARAGISMAGRADPGVILPDFQLLDQNGRPLTMHELAGRVLVMTFIYTRCPLPDFCPLMVKHLESVRRRADDEGIGGRLRRKRFWVLGFRFLGLGLGHRVWSLPTTDNREPNTKPKTKKPKTQNPKPKTENRKPKT
jgi:protein SCO1/2